MERPDCSSARARMLEFVIELGTHVPPERDWTAFDRFVDELAAQGWTRRDFYELTLEILEQEWRNISEGAYDVLTDFSGALEGDCLPESVPHFPGEPEDPNERIEYAQRKEWLDR